MLFTFENLSNEGRQVGFIIFLMGTNGIINTISWQSKKIRIVRSTLADETLVLKRVDHVIVWLPYTGN